MPRLYARAVAPKAPIDDAVVARLARQPDARTVLADYFEQLGHAEHAAFVAGGGSLVALAEAGPQLDDVLAGAASTHAIETSPQRALWLRATLAKLVEVQQHYLRRDKHAHPAYLGDGYDTLPFDRACKLLKRLASDILRAKPDASAADIAAVVDVMGQGDSIRGLRHWLPYAGLTALVERHVKAHGLAPAVRAALERASTRFFRNPEVVLGVDDKKVRARLEALT